MEGGRDRGKDGGRNEGREAGREEKITTTRFLGQCSSN